MSQEDTTPVRMHLLQFLQLQVNKQFIIPVYQRNYTWKKDTQLKQILSDLEGLLTEKYDKHFLGIIIYSLFKASNLGITEYSIIDGQQRLSTIFLILYAIRDILVDMGLDNDANMLEVQYLINPYLQGESRLKLKPLISDDTVLSYIVNKTITELSVDQKKSNVYQNYISLKEFFIDKIAEGYTIDQVLAALQKFYIVAVPVGLKDNPQQIFESINSTGAKLTAADLIRNYMLMNITSELQDKIYLEYWKVLEEILKGRDLEQFFRIFLASQMYLLVNKGLDIYEQFKKYVYEEKELSNDDDFDFIKYIATTIIRYSRYYNNVFYESNINYSPELNKSIKRFRRLKTETPSPLILKFFDLCFEDKLITERKLSEMIDSITNYLFRRLISGQDLNALSRTFPSLLATILNDLEKEDSYTYIDILLKKNMLNKARGKSGNNPDDAQLREFVLSNHNFYESKILRFLLDEMEAFQNPINVDLSSLSIEHLMPQTPNKQWLDYLKCDEDAYKDYLNRLGNLTLAAKPDNSIMGNKPFDYKQKILESTNHLNINKKILMIKEWNFEEIDKRTNEIIDQINILFPYEIVANEDLEMHNVYLKQDENNFAIASFCKDDGSVTVESGSSFNYYETANDDLVNETLKYLLESGIVRIDDNKESFIFNEAYTFTTRKTNDTALSISASLLLGGSRNGKEYWILENGKSVQTILQDIQKIGTYVYSYFLNAVKLKNIPNEIIKRLIDLEYSKKTFNMGYPIFKRISSLENIPEAMKDVKGNNIYWKQPFKFNNELYLICSQWKKKQRSLFDSWLESNLIGSIT